MFKTAWQRYKIFGDILIDFQGRAFTVLFYFTVMIPFGLGMRLLGDPLHTKGEVEWLKREPISDSLEEARRQG